jgi:hypothetical protein
MSKWKSVKDDPPTGDMERYVWGLYHSGFVHILSAGKVGIDYGSLQHWAEMESGVPPKWEEPMPEMVRVEGLTNPEYWWLDLGWRVEAKDETALQTILRVQHPNKRKAILLFNAVANAYNQALKEIQ